MHRIIPVELHWFVFAGIILLFLLVAVVRWVITIDREPNHQWRVTYLIVLLFTIAFWASKYWL